LEKCIQQEAEHCSFPEGEVKLLVHRAERNCRPKRNQARLESMMVCQIWSRLKLIFREYHRWFKAQPGQKKGGLWQSHLDRKASPGAQNCPCPDLGENKIGHETSGNSYEHLAIHRNGNEQIWETLQMKRDVTVW